MYASQAAKVILSSQGLSAWEAYTNGAYQRYYSGSGSTTAAPADWTQDVAPYLVPGYDTLTGAAGAAGSLAGVAQGAIKAGNWISTPNNWLRIAYVTGGMLVASIGLYMVIGSTVMRKAAPVVTGVVKSKTKGAISAATSNVLKRGD